MSNSRQPVLVESSDLTDLRTFAVNYLSGNTTGWHAHDWHQLVFAGHGVLEVQTAQRCWVVPPSRAVWVPAGMEHQLEAVAGVRLRTIYLLPFRCQVATAGNVLEIKPLLRELILHLVDERGQIQVATPDDQVFKQVLLMLISQASASPLELPMPRDAKLRDIAHVIRAQLAEGDAIRYAAQRAGTSRRTLERRFAEQVHMSLGKWVQLARLIQAARLLGQGRSVTDTAFDVGYESVSAFIAAFKRHFGVTPSRYFSGDV